MLEGLGELGDEVVDHGATLDADGLVGRQTENEERHRQPWGKAGSDVSPTGDARGAADPEAVRLLDTVDTVVAQCPGDGEAAGALAPPHDRRLAHGNRGCNGEDR